jgi:hypothetical protein
VKNLYFPEGFHSIPMMIIFTWPGGGGVRWLSKQSMHWIACLKPSSEYAVPTFAGTFRSDLAPEERVTPLTHIGILFT